MSAQSIAAQQVVDRARLAIQRKDAAAATSELTALRELSPGHAAIAELTRGINALVERVSTARRSWPTPNGPA